MKSYDEFLKLIDEVKINTTNQEFKFPHIQWNFYLTIPLKTINDYGYKVAAIMNQIKNEAVWAGKKHDKPNVELTFKKLELPQKLKVEESDVGDALNTLELWGLVKVDWPINDSQPIKLSVDRNFLNSNHDRKQYFEPDFKIGFINLSLLVARNHGLESAYLLGILLSQARQQYSMLKNKRPITNVTPIFEFKLENYFKSLHPHVIDALEKLRHIGIVEYIFEPTLKKYWFYLNIDKIQDAVLQRK